MINKLKNKQNITIQVVEFEEKFQHETYNFVWNNMLSVLNRETSKLKQELTPLENINNNYIAEGGNFWLAIDSDKIIGTIGLKKLNDEIYELRRFYVDLNYRGKQIGTKLYKELEDFARKKNVQYIQLKSSKFLKGAHKFYSKKDFINLNDYEDEKYFLCFIKALY